MLSDGQQRQRLRINVLGAVECWVDGDRVRPGGLVQERVLVALVLEAGKVLTVAQLVDSVWEEPAPATAPHQVRKAVAGLRQLLPGGARVLVTESSGYRVVLATGQSDAQEFAAALSGARAALADRDEEAAAGHLERALGLWRGPVLGGEGGHLIRSADEALRERRTVAVEQLVDLRLARGESSELVAELRSHVAEHPLRERLRGQLMLALFRSGRQAEALEEFGRVRALLADELGIDPGSELTALHERILRNDPGLARPRPERPAPRPQPPKPDVPARRFRSLPNDLTDFIGRSEELEWLRNRVESPPASGPLVLPIDGMGGAGKTSLAVRTAYAVADRYPDAQLYLDLRGFTPAEQPMSAPAAAEALLAMLGVPAGSLPDEPEARVEFWRTTVADMRLLLVLDNVADVAQVRPLLPPNPRCLVLITSRTRLIDLDGAHWISLGTMSDEDSRAMATTVLSDRRAAAEPEAVADLVELCGHLPLALRIALSRLANRPRWSISYLVDRMSDESRRLDELRSDERGVELTLKISYEGLDAHHRASFRLLGLHPGHDIDVGSAAALFGCTEEAAERTLEVLLDGHLLQQHEFGHYTFHDLVRSFVRRLLKSPGHASGSDVHDAVKRLLDYLMNTSDHVCDLLFSGRVRLPTGLTDPPAVPPHLLDRDNARAWLARERATLEAAAVLAHEREFDLHAAHLTRNVVFQLDALGLYPEFAKITQLSVLSSRRLGNPELLHLSLSNSAVAHWKLGRFEEGIRAASEAVDVARELEDKRGVAKGIGLLGLLTAYTGRFDEALPMLQESIQIKRELGVARAEAESLVNLSSLYEEWGRFEEAAEAAERAIALNDEWHIPVQQIIARASLAQALLGLRDYDEAERRLARARELIDEYGAPAGNAALVFALSARTHHELGRADLSRDYADLTLHHHRGHWSSTREVEIDNIIGRLRRVQGRPQEAITHHAHARDVASAIGYRVAEARALAGLAHAEHALGHTDSAREHLRRANGHFEAMGILEVAREEADSLAPQVFCPQADRRASPAPRTSRKR